MMNLIREMIEEALDPSAIREALATHIVDMIDYDDIAESLLGDVDSGDIAVVSINGNDATLKRVIKKQNAIVLQPENPAYEMKIFVGKEMEEVHIRGRLMKLEKRF